LSSVMDRVEGMAVSLDYDVLSMSETMEILLRLKAFGIVAITNEKPKFVDNIHIQPFVYLPELKAAYEGKCKIYDKNSIHLEGKGIK
jgi:hypothetical protein